MLACTSLNHPARERLPLSLITLALLSPLLAGNALAQADSHYHFGLGAGQTRGSVDGQRITDGVIAAPLGGFSSDGNAEQVPADAQCLDLGCAARRKPQP